MKQIYKRLMGVLFCSPFLLFLYLVNKDEGLTLLTMKKLIAFSLLGGTLILMSLAFVFGLWYLITGGGKESGEVNETEKPT